MNSNKITALATPTLSTDMASKQYVDDQIVAMSGIAVDIVNATNSDSSLTAGSTQILAGLVPLNMNAQKITSLADATSSADALNRQTADARYYKYTDTLNAIGQPTSSVLMNSQKIIALGNATEATDAINL